MVIDKITSDIDGNDDGRKGEEGSVPGLKLNLELNVNIALSRRERVLFLLPNLRASSGTAVKLRWKITTALAVLLSVVGCCLYFCYAHGAPWTGFNAVSNGMSADQVRRMLGPPDFIRLDARPDLDVFFYGGFQEAKFCTMEVYFDKNGTVVGKFHDH